MIARPSVTVFAGETGFYPIRRANHHYCVHPENHANILLTHLQSYPPVVLGYVRLGAQKSPDPRSNQMRET